MNANIKLAYRYLLKNMNFSKQFQKVIFRLYQAFLCHILHFIKFFHLWEKQLLMDFLKLPKINTQLNELFVKIETIDVVFV